MTKSNGSSSPFNLDITKLWGDIKSPAIDMSPMMDLQRRNMEAFASANQRAMEGLQTMARRNIEICKESMEGCTTILSEITAAGTPEEKIVKQIDLVKQTYENCLANMKEMQSLITKSNDEAIEVIASRISDSIDEIKTATKKSSKSKVAA